MKSTAIVLACGAIALTATSFIEGISMWGPLVLMCVFASLMTVWALASEPREPRAGVSFKKAA